MLIRNLIRTGNLTLAVFATVYEVMGHSWSHGVLRCPHGKYRLEIRAGRSILKVETCTKCDPGA
jgi:hypothetical protein